MSLRSPTLLPATHTNCYLVGEGDFVVVEPASPWTEEQRLLELAIEQREQRGHRLLGVMVTHHHVDHVSGVEALRRFRPTMVMAHGLTAKKLRGSIAIDREIDEGDVLHEGIGGGDVELVFTPGHAPGHLCVASRKHGWILAGDMVAGVGTILIDVEDDGDMDVYLASLETLAQRVPRVLLPAHGEPITDALGRLRFYVSHRLAREAKVLAAVEDGNRELAAVVARAYDDAPAALFPIAARSARAHLVSLEVKGKVTAEGDPRSVTARWRPRARPG